MPIYKGSTEVTSGNLRKGSTNIENGYKETSPFYTNTNGITINFIDAISGATMSTTQFSSVGVPGASFSSFSRTITVDSGRIFSTNPTVSESGDSGNNVTTSISSQTSTSAVLNVSGTYPTSGTTVTLTVNGATQVQLPNLNVSVSNSQATFSTSDSANLGTFNYSVSQSVSGGGSCSGGTQPTSGTFTSNSSSYNYPGFSAGYPAGGSFGNGCGVTCTSSVSASKSGYNSGSGSFSNTGSNPVVINTCGWSPSSNPSGAAYNTSFTCGITCPTCVTCAPGTSNCNIGLLATLSASPGANAFGSVGFPSVNYQQIVSCNSSTTFTNAIPAKATNWPGSGSISITQIPNNPISGNNAVTGGTYSASWSYPSSSIGASNNAAGLSTCQDTAGTTLTCTTSLNATNNNNSTSQTGGSIVIQCSGGNGTINPSTCTGTARLSVSQTGEQVSASY
jgi:hypothetical protein